MIPSVATIQTQLRRGTLEYCVLALLDGAPTYGLAIADAMRESTELLGSEGTLYPLLARLRKQGWVHTTWQESDSGPPRRYYALTDDGRAALGTFIESWRPFAAAVNHTIAGVTP